MKINIDKVKGLEKYLIDFFKNDTEIIGIYLSGSLADDSYDEYSDVDIRFVVETNDLLNFILKAKDKLTKNNKNILFFEPCCFNNAFIAHFDNFIKADIFFYTKEMIIESVWLKNIKIIKDFDNYLNNIKTNSQNLTFNINNEKIEEIILKFFATSHECYRRIKRNEFLYANQLFQNMKEIIISLFDFYFERANLYFYKAEKRFDADLIDLFNFHLYKNADNLIILEKLNLKFLQIEKLICEKFIIIRDFEKDKNILFCYNL